MDWFDNIITATAVTPSKSMYTCTVIITDLPLNNS